MKKMRVFLVDDHPIVRDGLRAVLETDEIEVVGEAGSGEDAISQIPPSSANIVLMDVKLPGIDGIEALRELLRIKPSLIIIALTSFGSEHVIRAIEAGAKGYLLKGRSSQELKEAIYEAYEGHSPIDPIVTGQLMVELKGKGRTGLNGSPLTPRETEVLELVASGNANKRIAQRLNISEQTVKNSLSTILKKVGANDRTHAVIICLRNGWIFVDSIAE
jgi:DNA-binding NarL/FixJ family response regulator